MDLANPMQSVIPSAHGAVLAALARTDLPLSGHRIAELTKPKFSQTRVNDVLRHLTQSGVVLREKRPPSNLYRLNHDHVAADGILQLARMSATLVARIRAELETGLSHRRLPGCSAQRRAGKAQNRAISIFFWSCLPPTSTVRRLTYGSARLKF
jgi:hypothetical protein